MKFHFSEINVISNFSLILQHVLQASNNVASRYARGYVFLMSSTKDAMKLTNCRSKAHCHVWRFHHNLYEWEKGSRMPNGAFPAYQVAFKIILKSAHCLTANISIYMQFKKHISTIASIL